MQQSNTAITIFINYFDQKIKGRYFVQKNPNAPSIILFPPDPKYGGNINNKIIVLLEEIFQKCGFSTLAIDLKTYCSNSSDNDRNILEYLNLAAKTMDWFHNENKTTNFIWVAGYSFGAYIAADLAIRRPEVENFILISPLVNHYDFSFLCPPLLSSLIITGEQDQFINKQTLTDLLSNIQNYNSADIDFIQIEGADHKYTEKTKELYNALENYINIKVATRVAKPVRKKRRKRQKKDKSFDIFN